MLPYGSLLAFTPNDVIDVNSWPRFNPYPLHYRAAFAFSAFLYPHPIWACLTACLPIPMNGRDTGLPCSVQVTNNKWVRSCLFHRQCDVRVTPKFRRLSDCLPFGSSLSTSLARCTLRCLSDSSLSLTIPLSQAPRTDWCYQPLTSPYGLVFSLRKGYLVWAAVAQMDYSLLHVPIGYSRRNWRSNHSAFFIKQKLHNHLHNFTSHELAINFHPANQPHHRTDGVD